MVDTCKVCGVTSKIAEFYDGLKSRCKECHKQKVRENRTARAGYYRAYDAERYQNDPKVRERHQRYQKTEAGRASMRKSRQKWLDENEEKRAAHVILGNAVRDGRKQKPVLCEGCGEAPSRLHGHHEDYSKPLDVVWLCPKCHRAAHFNKEARV